MGSPGVTKAKKKLNFFSQFFFFKSFFLRATPGPSANIINNLSEELYSIDL